MIIGERKIGPDQKPFIIAEVGINHNGDLDTAFKMIEVAKKIGFEAVKFQTFKAEEFNINKDETYTYKSQGQTITESMLEMFKRYEFSVEEWHKIKKKCDDENIMFLSTPQNKSDLDILLDIGIPAIKVGSDDFVNVPLLREYSKVDLPLMLSIGMADMGEIYKTLEVVNAFWRDDVLLFLCTSEYPTASENVNLKKLSTLKAAFPNVQLGFSDHTAGALAAPIAVGFGACVFEKHFTLDNNMPGPDHWFSANPTMLKQWYYSINEAWKMLGSAELVPTAKEKEMRKLARRSLYVTKNIKAGEKITVDKIGLYRPNIGIEGAMWDYVDGMYATKDLKAGVSISWGDFSDE